MRSVSSYYNALNRCVRHVEFLQTFPLICICLWCLSAWISIIHCWVIELKNWNTLEKNIISMAFSITYCYSNLSYYSGRLICALLDRFPRQRCNRFDYVFRFNYQWIAYLLLFCQQYHRYGKLNMFFPAYSKKYSKSVYSIIILLVWHNFYKRLLH